LLFSIDTIGDRHIIGAEEPTMPALQTTSGSAVYYSLLKAFRFARAQYPELKSLNLFPYDFQDPLLAGYYFPFTVYVNVGTRSSLHKLRAELSLILYEKQPLTDLSDEESVVFTLFHEMGHAYDDWHDLIAVPDVPSDIQEYTESEAQADKFAAHLLLQYRKGESRGQI